MSDIVEKIARELLDASSYGLTWDEAGEAVRATMLAMARGGHRLSAEHFAEMAEVEGKRITHVANVGGRPPGSTLHTEGVTLLAFAQAIRTSVDT